MHQHSESSFITKTHTMAKRCIRTKRKRQHVHGEGAVAHQKFALILPKTELDQSFAPHGARTAIPLVAFFCVLTPVSYVRAQTTIIHACLAVCQQSVHRPLIGQYSHTHSHAAMQMDNASLSTPALFSSDVMNFTLSFSRFRTFLFPFFFTPLQHLFLTLCHFTACVLVSPSHHRNSSTLPFSQVRHPSSNTRSGTKNESNVCAPRKCLCVRGVSVCTRPFSPNSPLSPVCVFFFEHHTGVRGGGAI
jgi:hypothetical protein